MTPLSCKLSAPWITALGAGDHVTFRPIQNHIETCLRCQAAVVRQRRVRRSLEDLGSVSEVAPVTRVAFRSAPETRRNRQAVAGAVGAALVVGVGVIGLRKALAD